MRDDRSPATEAPIEVSSVDEVAGYQYLGKSFSPAATSLQQRGIIVVGGKSQPAANRSIIVVGGKIR